jgi:hypothetical protein
MIAPAPDNPTGFWESASVVATNDRILNDTGSAWYDCLDFDCNKLDLPSRTVALTYMMLSVLSDYANSDLLLIKDPRLCLLLDLWLPVLQQMKISPALLLVIREPQEVASSLAQRNALPTTYATALWLRYVLATEYASRESARCILAYDEVLHDWRSEMARTSRELGITWPVGFAAVTQQIDGFLNNQLRHHRVRAACRYQDGGLLGFWADEVYEILLKLDPMGDCSCQLERLDQLRSVFGNWCDAYARVWSDTVLANHALRSEPRLDIPSDWEAIAHQLPLIP